MSESTIVHIGENSPEQVAYKLFFDVIKREATKSSANKAIEQDVRKYLLDAYAECLRAVRYPEERFDHRPFVGAVDLD